MYRKSIGSPLHHLFNWKLYKQTYTQWSADNAGRLAAALAYHSAMAAAPLVIGALAIVGLVYDTKLAQLQLVAQVDHFVGLQGGEIVKTILTNADQPVLVKWAGILSFILLLWSASNVFVELQNSLNTVWGVQLRADLPPRRKVQHRLLPLMVVLGIGLLLLAITVAGTALTAMGDYLSNLFPTVALFWQIFNYVISLVMITILFALVFKFLPDVEIRWPDLWPGSLLTGILFVLGQFVLGWYLGRQSSASVYGAAGSIIVLLLWLYYSAQIFLFGAEFTEVYATHYGHGVLPAKDAVAHDIIAPDKPAAIAATAGVMEESDAEEALLSESSGQAVAARIRFEQESALEKPEFKTRQARVGREVGVMTEGGKSFYAAILLGLLSVTLMISRFMPMWLALLVIGALVSVEGWLVTVAPGGRLSVQTIEGVKMATILPSSSEARR